MIGAVFCLLLLSEWQPFAGRWDLTVKQGDAESSGWLELAESGGKPTVRLVGRVGSVHPIEDASVVAGRLRFSTKEWYGAYERVDYDLAREQETLLGTLTRQNGAVTTVRGERAPDLKRAPVARWSEPSPLFNGTDLSGWQPMDPQRSQWKAAEGVLVNQGKGANIRTTAVFDDFKLHLEFRCPEGANTGVYLRGRYEIQIQVGPCKAPLHCLGALYGYLAPSAILEPKADQWRSLDAELVGRTVTVVVDGQTLIDRKEIPGPTGGALDSHEALPGPFLLQGDHSANQYRHITIRTPLR